jgi:membrane-associated protein
VELIAGFIDIVLHLDRHLQWLVANYGPWIYAILFAIIFCETGLVVTPFLPGDSLLFVAGAVAASGGMDVHALFAVLVTASFTGDNTNYWIGRYAGPRLFRRERSVLLNPAHLARTQRFYERHGGKTVLIARFVPIVRTFAPVLAGVGEMNRRTFTTYNIVGGFVWGVGVTVAGYILGEAIGEDIDKYLLPIIAVIVVLSILPPVIEMLRERRRNRTAATTPAADPEAEAAELHRAVSED